MEAMNEIEIEIKACINTANELRKNDGYMEVKLKEIIDYLENRARELNELLK